MSRLADFSRGIKDLWTKYHFLVPPRLWKKYFRSFNNLILGDKIFIKPFDKKGYNKWLKNNEKSVNKTQLTYRPLISVLIPVYNAEPKFLKECIESVLGQSYDNFELCIVDDHSSKKETLDVLKEYEGNEKIKIKHRTENGHISKATNDALAEASGEFVALLDNDDLLSKDALLEVALVLNNDKKIDMVYSDEDKIDLNGDRCDPHFKPDFSPDTLLSLNYICHLSVLRTSIVKKIGGLRPEYDGAQDYDLFLRFTEQTKNICHISKILYHWRMSETSTALNMKNKSYAEDKGKLAIEDALKRRGVKAEVKKDPASMYYQVVYKLEKQPMVSIIIPTKDYADVTEKCLESVYKKTTYKNFEVILVNNNSEKPETFELFEKYRSHQNFRVIDANIEFNYARINNLAAMQAKGDVVVLLNNDTEIITPEWLEILVGYAVQPHIGVVGAKLLYPDNTVQHAGIIMGLGGVASHAYLGEERDSLGLYGRLRVPYDYAGVTGACLVVEKKKYNLVGGLEEDLKVAYNDVDFDLKLLAAGYYNVEVPMVELYHHESKSRGTDTAPEKKARFDAEQEYMYKKWPKEIENDKFYNPNYSKKMWFVLDRKPE